MRVGAHSKLAVLTCFVIVKTVCAGNWAVEHMLASAAYDKGDYAAAEEHDRAALALAESFGGQDPRLEATLTHLAVVLQARVACCSAEPLLRRALAIREARFGDDSIETAFSKMNLASICLEAGRREESRRLSGEVLTTAQRLLKPDDPALIPYLALAAVGEQDAMHYKNAEELLNQARLLAEHDSFRNPHALTQAWRYLGALYRLEGRFDDAEHAYRNFVSVAEARFGPDKLDTAVALTGLGGALCARKFYADARPILLRALDIYQRTHELAVPTFAVTIQDLAIAELYLGQSHAAEEHSLLAISVLGKRPNSGEALAVAYNNLGQVYASEGRFKAAEEATLQAKDMWTAISGPESLKLAAAISNIGALCLQQHKYKKAEIRYREAAAMDAHIAGEDSVDYAREMNRLGVLYNCEKRFPRAEKVLRLALEIESKKLGIDSPILAETYLNLAGCLHSQHRREEALECYQHGFDIVNKAGQKDAPNMAGVLEQYSMLLREMKRFADAERVSTEALGIRVKETINGETYR